MRIFLDTNVLVSAFTTRGLCADVLRVILRDHTLLTGEFNLRELRRVLRTFTRSGLEKFGCPEVLAEFPLAFRQGMSDSLRAERVLKDTGHDSPANWNWGNSACPVDAALIVYAAPSAGASAVQSVSAGPLALLRPLAKIN